MTLSLTEGFNPGDGSRLLNEPPEMWALAYTPALTETSYAEYLERDMQRILLERLTTDTIVDDGLEA